MQPIIGKSEIRLTRRKVGQRNSGTVTWPIVAMANLLALLRNGSLSLLPSQVVRQLLGASELPLVAGSDVGSISLAKAHGSLNRNN